MKKLFIVRHGKSDWNHDGWPDIDRPLKNKGLNDTYEIAESLLYQQEKPDFIYSSPANRALHTAIIFARVHGKPASIINILDDLYLPSAQTVLSIVKLADNSINNLMIVGHNPGFTDFANLFIKDSIYEIPTSGVVKLKFDTDNWKDISAKICKLESFEYPKKEI